MSIDRSPEVRAEMLIQRLELADGASLKFEYMDETTNLRVTALTLSDSDDWDAVNVDNLFMAKDFTRVRFLDFVGAKTIVKKTETILFDGHRWKIDRVDPPFGSTRLWTLRLNRLEDIIV